MSSVSPRPTSEQSLPPRATSDARESRYDGCRRVADRSGLRSPCGPISPAIPWVSGHGIAVEPVDEVLSQDMIAQLRKTLSVEVRQHLHRIFEELLPSRVAAIENAARSGDTVELRHTAHLLRGSSLMLGATRLGQICRQLEDASAGKDAVVAERQVARLVAVADEARQALREQLA